MQKWATQDGFDLRFDWGPAGVLRLAGHVATVVIVDVLRFTSAVETACSAGVEVYPYRWKDDSAAQFARTLDAVLAGSEDGPSLSPLSMLRLPHGSRVVLPSPNGATCSLLASDAGSIVVAASLRNAAAVADWLGTSAHPVAVIACGEVSPDGSIRPALEDLLGAGSVLSGLSGRASPEADAAIAAFHDASIDLRGSIENCASGRELVEYRRLEDVEWCSRLNASQVVPLLTNGAYRAAM